MDLSHNLIKNNLRRRTSEELEIFQQGLSAGVAVMDDLIDKCSDWHYQLSTGVFLGLVIQFFILNIRIILMQRKFKYSGEIQIASAFLSIILNFGVIVYLLYSVNNFSLIFGFFIAHNLNILNIALITNLSVKKND